MSKFALECPKCGSINTASTFIFAKKVIECGTCREEINIRQSRLTSKVCPHCGKVFVCDQAKTKDKKCPSCGKDIWISEAATAVYKMVSVNCPQCACAIEVDKTKETYFCPLCDCQLDVKKELAKSKLVSDTGISVIQYEGDNSTFVWKHPVEDFNLGSQLIVHESQEAVFFLNGEALDTFGPGRHTLETENLPVLKKIYSLPTGSQTPFHAEVYFVNKTVQLGMKWGTDSRVRFVDPATGIPLDIGASGEMNLQVSDSRRLLFKLVGTTGGLTGREILSATAETADKARSALKGYFRAPLMTEIKSYLAAVIKEQQISIFEIDSHMSALSDALRARISPKLEEYGLSIPQFYITNISLPEDDKNFKDIRALISQAYIGVKKEEVQTGIAEAARQRKLVEEQTEAQLRMIRAQAEAEAVKAKGMAEAEVMQAKGYSEKDVLAADVQKAYAEGLGKMGSSGSGSSGGMASDLIGLMAGMKMAGNLLDRMEGTVFPPSGDIPGSGTASGSRLGADGGIPSGSIPGTDGSTASGSRLGADGSIPSASIPGTGTPVSAVTWTCSCGETANLKGFCMSCGRPRPEAKKADTWNCPSCGAEGVTSKFCPECGAKRPERLSFWNCPECGCKDIPSKFCPECGSKKPE